MTTLASLIAAITPIDGALEPALRALLDGKAKPPGSLGRLEDLAVRIGLIQNRLDPRIARTDLYVFAGDHGLTNEGVSAYPASVTAAMVGLFLTGRSSVGALARATGVQVRVVDAGVDADLPAHPELIAAKVRRGTRNAAASRPSRRTRSERRSPRGRHRPAAAADEADVIALGEMGIGNSSSAALIMHRLAAAPLDGLHRPGRRPRRRGPGAQAGRHSARRLALGRHPAAGRAGPVRRLRDRHDGRGRARARPRCGAWS